MLIRIVILTALCLGVIASATVARGDRSPGHTAFQSENKPLPVEEAKKLKSPVSYTKDSITKGRTLFIRDCTGCHGHDGKSQVDVIANATDLTEPKLWQHGTSEGEIFRSIRDGSGDNMPAFKSQIRKEEDLWHLVNFIRSLWPEPVRPKLQNEKTN